MKDFTTPSVIIGAVAILAASMYLIGDYNGVRRGRHSQDERFYSQETDIHDAVSTDLAPSIDFKQAKTTVESESGDTAIDTKRCFYRLAPYTMRWRNVLDFWQANLYVPAGMGEAVKAKLEVLEFVDSVIIRNSQLYRHPADDRLEIDLSKRAGKDHAEMLGMMLPGIMDAVKEGL